MTSITHAREIYEEGRMEGRKEGRKEGRRECRIQDILDMLGELGGVPESLRERVLGEENPETLSRWVRLAAKAESVSDFKERM